MIKTPLSTMIGGAFWTPKATILGGTSNTFDQLIKSLFANGEQGFAYDPNDLSTMFQDATGAVPVTGAGQPVGLALDKSKGLVVGSELTPQVALWTGSANWTVDVQNAKATLVNSSTSSDDLSLGGVSASYMGQVFEIRFRILSISGGTVTVDSSRLLGVAPPQYSSPGMYRYFAYASNTGEGVFRININVAGVSCVIDNISVRELPGNHARQTTSSMRPLLVASPQRIDYDTVDDKLITNLPAQLTGCTVIRSVPNVGTQILAGQTIPATYNDNTDHCGLIVINRTLTPSETATITAEFNKRAGV